MRAMAAANLDLLQMSGAECMMDTNFYHALNFSMVRPSAPGHV